MCGRMELGTYLDDNECRQKRMSSGDGGRYNICTRGLGEVEVCIITIANENKPYFGRKTKY